MKASELIAELEKAIQEHGDLEVGAQSPRKVRFWLDEEEQESYFSLSERPTWTGLFDG